MNNPELKYVYHDSYIHQIRYEGDSIEVDIQLCPAFNPDCEMITLMFKDICNYRNTRKYFDEIIQEAKPVDVEKNKMACRVDTVLFNCNKTTTENDFYLIFVSDGAGKQNIHCKEFFENKINL
jgi:hypothetical protein